MTTTNGPVMVTGASGYLASWIVERLLGERFPGRLELFQADLLTDGSFDRAMVGCEIVIHAASPYFLEQPKDVERELVRPAVEGTLNVISSANRTPTVRRVVLTSSIATLYADARDAACYALNTIEEEHSNTNTSVAYQPYAYSKTAAEQAAWDVHKRRSRWDLITIHPGAIFGPSLSRRVDATSVGMMLRFLNGAFRMGVPSLWLGVVDVRDAAMAHVRAAFHPGAAGRYIVVAKSLTLLEISRLMRLEDLGIVNKLPKGETAKALMWILGPLVGLGRRYIARNVGYPVAFNNSRSRTELGIEYRAPATTLNDHIRQVAEDGLLLA